MDAYGQPQPQEEANWIRKRSRLPVAIGTGMLAYALMAFGPLAHRFVPFLGVVVFFTASFAVFLGLARMVYLRDPRPGHAALRGAALYLGIGVVSMLVWASGQAALTGAASLFTPREILHAFVMWIAWPTMWLWFHGCTLPVLTACPGG